MTNRLELNWKLDGFVAEQRYYCSETPFTAETKPSAKAVLANDARTYVDTAVDSSKTYYVAVGSVKNGVEKISEVKEINSHSYRYYRIYITENNGELYTALQEVELAETIGGLDVTTASMQTAESSYYEPSNASKAFNNNFNNIEEAWVTATGQSLPSWVSIDLGANKDVVELRMWAQQYSYGLGRAPKSFIIQGSYNNIDWVDIKPFSNVVGWQLGTAKKFNLITGLIT